MVGHARTVSKRAGRLVLHHRRSSGQPRRGVQSLLLPFVKKSPPVSVSQSGEIVVTLAFEGVGGGESAKPYKSPKNDFTITFPAGSKPPVAKPDATLGEKERHLPECEHRRDALIEARRKSMIASTLCFWPILVSREPRASAA